MNYSIHTLELTLTLETKQYSKLVKKAYDEAKKGKHRVFPDQERLFVHIDTIFADKGIKIEYHGDKYEKKIKFIPNPTTLLGGNDVKKLWKPDKENVSEFIGKLDRRVEDYFDMEYSLSSFKLTRVDFTVNIDVGDRELVSSYIKVLHRIGKVKGFALKYKKNEEWIDKDRSFDLAGNSNDIQYTAYDKEKALKAKLKKAKKDSLEDQDLKSKIKAAKGMLRVEIRLMKPKAIRKYTDKKATEKQIKDLAGQCEKIFMDTFKRVIPYGDYYKKDEAVKLIELSSFKRNQKDKMLKLIDLITAKKSLLLAQREMDYRHVDLVMEWFAKIGVSPVTIGKRADVKYLKSLYRYL
jgi:hypothetical protein